MTVVVVVDRPHPHPLPQHDDNDDDEAAAAAAAPSSPAEQQPGQPPKIMMTTEKEEGEEALNDCSSSDSDRQEILSPCFGPAEAAAEAAASPRPVRMLGRHKYLHYREYKAQQLEQQQQEAQQARQDWIYNLQLELRHTPDPLIAVDRHWLTRLIQQACPDARPPWVALAPMVDQSDFPFRLLCRRYGCHVAYTPMIHARLLVHSEMYRHKFTLAATGNPLARRQDRPLIAQLCGDDVATVVQAARLLAPYCDALDLNCGCPQAIAKRGHYGAFLLEEPAHVLALVRALVRTIPLPITCKVRLVPSFCYNPISETSLEETSSPSSLLSDQAARLRGINSHNNDYIHDRDTSIQASLHLYQQLVQEGIHLLTVHGRTRFHKGPRTGPSDWDAIRTVVEHLGDRIPILANGSMSNRQEMLECWQQTQADGVMLSEAILEYPAAVWAGPASLGETTTGSSTASLGETTTGSSTTLRPIESSLVGEDPILPRVPTDDERATTPAPISTTPPSVRYVGRLQLAQEYLILAKQHPPQCGGQGSGMKCLRAHIHRMLHADMQNSVAVRTAVVEAKTWSDLWQACEITDQVQRSAQHDWRSERLSWYGRHEHLTRDAFGVTIRSTPRGGEEDGWDRALAGDNDEEEEEEDEKEIRHDNSSQEMPVSDAAECFADLFAVPAEWNQDDED